MSVAQRQRKALRRQMKKSTDALKNQMMVNTLRQPFWRRVRMAVVILFKRAI